MQQHLLTIDEISSKVAPYSELRSSQGRAWSGVNIVQRRLATEDLVVPPMAYHTLVVITGQPVSVTGRVADVKFEGRLAHGSTTLIPASAESSWRYHPQDMKTHDVLHIYLDPSLLSHVADNLESPLSDVVGTIGVLDQQIDHIGQLLVAELTSDGFGGAVYVESLANVLAIQLLRRYSVRPAPTTAHEPHGLPASVVSRVVSYIDDHLASSISLAELACVAHLSPYHFARMFRRSTGASPHQCILARRVERAKQLLVTETLSLAEVATAVGFSDQSHLTYHVRRQLGLTPRQLRDTARSS